MYCGLPLILSDVGSARTVIQEEDVGIVIRNPYERLNDVTTEMILNRYRDDSHLDNLDDLVAAMERIGRNREEWKRKGLAGREKVMKIFNASQMCRSYAACFQELIAQEKARAG
jgi:glycosyltransferase involved in cell wall biosynthesis